MLNKRRMEAVDNSQDQRSDTVSASLQLLLFVDKRPYSAEKIRQIRSKLKDLSSNYPVDLQVIDVSEQPHLAEHFKLVATPTLVKLHPDPRQTLAGSDIAGQLASWWERWQRSLENYDQEQSITPVSPTACHDSVSEPSSAIASVAYSAELIQLSDEIFQLRQEKEDLAEQVRFKDRLIAMLAHDLRNPITAVSIALETLELGINETIINPNDPKMQARFTPELMGQLLKHARVQTKAVDRMITDVLQVARGSGGGFDIQPQQLDLGALCGDVLIRMDSQFQHKSQEIDADIPCDLPFVYADPERVEQVLVNLLDNAIKYTPLNGRIRLTILHRTTQKIQVSICDDGPGIPEENRDRIFEDRFRLERDESKDGYGIGLSLCQRVIRAHYGQIWVDSVMGKGSCFHFTLPVYRS